MLSHPFHDIEVAAAPGHPEWRLLKMLTQDGRRFTYLVKGELDEGAIEFVKRMLDGGVNTDLVIDRAADGRFQARESPDPLPKHG